MRIVVAVIWGRARVMPVELVFFTNICVNFFTNICVNNCENFCLHQFQDMNETSVHPLQILRCFVTFLQNMKGVYSIEINLLINSQSDLTLNLRCPRVYSSAAGCWSLNCRTAIWEILTLPDAEQSCQTVIHTNSRPRS